MTAWMTATGRADRRTAVTSCRLSRAAPAAGRRHTLGTRLTRLLCIEAVSYTYSNRGRAGAGGEPTPAAAAGGRDAPVAACRHNHIPPRPGRRPLTKRTTPCRGSATAIPHTENGSVTSPPMSHVDCRLHRRRRRADAGACAARGALTFGRPDAQTRAPPARPTARPSSSCPSRTACCRRTRARVSCSTTTPSSRRRTRSTCPRCTSPWPPPPPCPTTTRCPSTPTPCSPAPAPPSSPTCPDVYNLVTIALLTPDELIEPPHGIENIFSLSFRRVANAAFTPAARPAIAAATTYSPRARTLTHSRARAAPSCLTEPPTMTACRHIAAQRGSGARTRTTTRA